MGVLVSGVAGSSGRAHRAKGASVKATGRKRIHLMTLRLRQLHQRLAVDRSRLAAPVPVHEEVQVVLLHGVGAQHGDRFANKGAIAVCHDDFRDEGLGLVGCAALGRAVGCGLGPRTAAPAENGRELFQRGVARVGYPTVHELRDPRVADARLLGYLAPLASALGQAVSNGNVKFGGHAHILAILC